MQQAINLTLPSQKLTTAFDRLIIDGMEYVSVEEAADISGYSPQYIRRLLRQDKIEGVKKGYMWWISLDSLKAYKKEMDLLGSEKFSPHKNDE